MYKAIDAVFNAYEDTEVSDVANNTVKNRTYRVTLNDECPWVRLSLLHAQRNALLRQVNIENECCHIVTNFNNL
jgi:hypothetical protein